MRRLVITSQTEHQLKAIGQSRIDEADVHEHLRACQEVRNIGKCLADMAVTLHSHIEHYCPDAKLRDVGAIAEEMANEAQTLNAIGKETDRSLTNSANLLGKPCCNTMRMSALLLIWRDLIQPIPGH